MTCEACTHNYAPLGVRVVGQFRYVIYRCAKCGWLKTEAK